MKKHPLVTPEIVLCNRLMFLLIFLLLLFLFYYYYYYLSTTITITDITIEMDLQDMSGVKNKLLELVNNIITHLAKPQVLSNIVNNVFSPLDCILSKFNTTRAPGGLEFVVRCGNVTALVKIQESVNDGTLVKQIERAVFTVEVIGEENLTRVSMKTKIDEETYQEAYEKLQKSG